MRKLGINYRAEKPENKVDEEILARLKDRGFDAIFTGLGNPDNIDALAPKARAAGISYDFIHAPFDGINHMWKPGEDGEEMLRRLILTSEVCARNEIPISVVHLSAGEKAPCVNDCGIERFDRLIEASTKLGVKIAIENQRKIGNIACLMERYVNEPLVGFCWDNGHEACFTPGREYMPLFGNRLICLHLHDNRNIYNADDHYLPFDGMIDFNRVAKHIHDSGFEGTLMLEVSGRGSKLYSGLSEEEYLERAYMRVNRLRELVDG